MKTEHFPTLFGCASGKEGHVVIVGAPYDRSTSPNRVGCVAAPAQLRALSGPDHFRVREGEVFDLGRRETIFKGCVVSDIGNIRFRYDCQSDDQYMEFIAQAITVIANEGKKPLVLGGDHVVTLAALRGLARAGKKFQVIQLDAHHDYETIRIGERPTHASFVSYVAAEHLAEQVLQIGVRGLAWGAPKAPEIVKSIRISELRQHLLPNVDVYLTIDTDAFDPTVLPAVSYPVPEGLPFAALREVLDGLRELDLNTIGADWTEYNPSYDSNNQISGRFILVGLSQLIQSMTRDLREMEE